MKRTKLMYDLFNYSYIYQKLPLKYLKTNTFSSEQLFSTTVFFNYQSILIALQQLFYRSLTNFSGIS